MGIAGIWWTEAAGAVTGVRSKNLSPSKLPAAHPLQQLPVLAKSTAAKIHDFRPDHLPSSYTKQTSLEMALNGDKMEVETAELKLKEMAHSEQHYFNRYVRCVPSLRREIT